MMRTNNTFYNFTGLTSNNSYTVTVAGSNDAGEGKTGMLELSTLTMKSAIPRSEFCGFYNLCYWLCMSYQAHKLVSVLLLPQIN